MLGDGIEGYISYLEDRHRTRRYATGRIDTSLCTKENLDALIKELRDIKKKGNITGEDHSDITETYLNAMKKASTAVSQILRYWLVNSNEEGMARITQEKYPRLYEELQTQAYNSETSRENTFASHVRFNNKFSGISYELGHKQTRMLHSLCRMCESEGMSDDEAMEIFEGLNIADWKDYDPNDEQQVKEAEDRYFNKMSDHLAGLAFECSNEIIDVGNFITNRTNRIDESDGDAEDHIDSPVVMGGFEVSIDQTNAHRSDYEGWEIPKLSEEEEKNVWKILRA